MNSVRAFGWGGSLNVMSSEIQTYDILCGIGKFSKHDQRTHPIRQTVFS